MKYAQNKNDIACEIEREIIAEIRREYGNEGYQLYFRDRKNRAKVGHQARAIADLEFARMHSPGVMLGLK